LNPDEAFHFFLARQISVRSAYQASFFSAHPPLLVLVLYYWQKFGNGEFWLRLPSVLSGIASCWLAYKWWLKIADSVTALTGLILLSFSPVLVGLQSEVRQYSLLLLFETAALYLLERALQEQSKAMAAFSAMALWLTISVHYSGLLFAAALGIYATLRFLALRPSSKIFAICLAGQVGAAILGMHFFTGHISHIQPTMEMVANS
jgi:mannosyltransferase